MFVVWCFARAENIQLVGPPTQEATWFAEHAWEIALCALCRAHLGWRFSGASEFYGLIREALRE